MAVLDTTTGALRPLGGGLLRASRDQVVAPMVHHAVRGEELWFSGLFDHAGVNANSRLQGPVESAYVAMWHPTANQDPNHGLTVKPVAALPANTGSSSQTHKVTLEAELADEGTITWYERGSGGSWQKRGTGPKLQATLRVPPGSGDLYYHVTVTRPEGRINTASSANFAEPLRPLRHGSRVGARGCHRIFSNWTRSDAAETARTGAGHRRPGPRHCVRLGERGTALAPLLPGGGPWPSSSASRANRRRRRCPSRRPA